MQHAGRTTNTFSKKYTARFTKSTYHVKCGPRKHLNFSCLGEPTAQARTFPTSPPRSLNSSCRDASNHLSYAWFHRNFKTAYLDTCPQYCDSHGKGPHSTNARTSELTPDFEIPTPRLRHRSGYLLPYPTIYSFARIRPCHPKLKKHS